MSMDENARKEFYENKGIEYVQQNMVERFFDKLFFALTRDVKVTFLALTIIYAGFITFKYISSLEARMQASNVFRDRMIKEVRRDLQPIIQRKIEIKTKKIEHKVDNANKNLIELQKTVNSAIEQLKK